MMTVGYDDIITAVYKHRFLFSGTIYVLRYFFFFFLKKKNNL